MDPVRLAAGPGDLASVPGRLQAQCLLWPERIAATCGGAQLSYAAFWSASGAVALGLRQRGVRRGDRVALLLPRGLDALAAIAGILRAGAAYVPLDPSQPAERLRDMLADCAPAALVTGTAAGAAPVGTACVPIEALLASTGVAPEPDALGPDDAAYVMYTSGSTGRPKGVVVPHRAILRLVVDTDYVTLEPEEVLLQMAPLAFDASTFEIFGALLNGGRLAILTADPPTLDQIADIIGREGVTTAWLTAGLFNVIADRRVDALRPLRQLLVGGDVVSPPHLRAVRQACPGLRLINGYGPTENTTFTCCHTITDADLAGGAIPIGRAVRGTTVHVLDERLQKVVDGADGQLCAGGAGVALGYLNQPELTAARFVADPFSPRPGAKLYLTGDRAVRDANGTIRFLGRVDRQVKVDGHRIELDEVEQALRNLDGVGDAVAVVHADRAGRKRLIGYVTGGAGTPAELSARLGRCLPHWAVPSRIIRLPALPLTANGKVDRARLPDLSAEPDAGAAPPRGGIEQKLAAIVAGVLGVASVGREANFFDLGATSLQLIELHAAITRVLRTDLKLLALFAAPSVSQLAARLADGAAPHPVPDAADRARRAAAALQRVRAARVA